MNRIHKILGFIFTLFFGYATIVQFNDSDALQWVLLYLLATIGSMFFAYGKFKKQWSLALAFSYLVLAFYYWPDDFEGIATKEGINTSNVELARESLGMGIAALVMLLYSVILLRVKKN